jgi:choice-of-anchor B domain-containing protein
VSDPERPIHVATLLSQTRDSLWRDIKVYDGHAFVVSEARDHGMQVLDLSELRDVTDPPATLSATVHYAGFGNAHNLAIDEETGFAYAVGSNTCSHGLHLVDVRDPRNPIEAGCFPGDSYTHDTQCVVYRGPDLEHRGREICFNSNKDSIRVVDVTDKTMPRELSREDYANLGYVHQGWLSEDHAFFLQGDELDELSLGHGSRTYVWDMSDLDAPRLLGSHTSVSPSIDHNLYVRRDHVFQANYTSGLRVLRFGRLEKLELVEVAYFDTQPASDAPGFDGAWSVFPFFESGTVVVSDLSHGLFVLQPDLDEVAECSDQLDNDGDGRVDFPEDPSCAGPGGARELPRSDVEIDLLSGSLRWGAPAADRGLVSVAILGSDSFDVDDVEPRSLSLGDGGAPLAHSGEHAIGPAAGHVPWPRRSDVNRDGWWDLVGHYELRASGITAGDLVACLHWTVRSGTPYESCATLPSPQRGAPASGRATREPLQAGRSAMP